MLFVVKALSVNKKKRTDTRRKKCERKSMKY
jgi:hypothetical protein